MLSRPDQLHFTIGEFSKLTGIPKQTLQFYDRIGLFMPAVRLENGYRYYQHGQLELLEIIVGLREADVPLSEIRNYLSKRTPDYCLERIQIDRAKIAEKIKVFERMLEVMDDLEAVISMGKKAAEEQELFSVEFMEEEHYIFWESTATTEKEYLEAVVKASQWCKSHGVYSGYGIGAYLDEERLRNKAFDGITGLCLKLGARIDSDLYFIKPAGNYAVYHHKGHTDKLQESYHLFFSLIASKGLEFEGSAYELGLIDYFSSQKHDDYITRIVVKLK